MLAAGYSPPGGLNEKIVTRRTVPMYLLDLCDPEKSTLHYMTRSLYIITVEVWKAFQLNDSRNI